MNFLEPSSFRELDDFPLKWRWTDEKWDVLPDDAVILIRPYTDLRAREILELSLKFGNAEGLFQSRFDKVEQFDASVDPAKVTEWLQRSTLGQKQQVVVSWDHHLAVLVDCSVFCEYWDDFCYPSSDDVAIFPIDMKWVLFYFHNEYFEFGMIKSFSE